MSTELEAKIESMEELIRAKLQDNPGINLI